MLVESVSVKNFKILGDFSVEGLRRVTLLGGDNGCGKTTLLEAVQLCFNVTWDKSLIPPLLAPLRSTSIMNDNSFTRLSHGGENAPIEVSCVENNVSYSVKAKLARALPMAGGAGTFADIGKTAGGGMDVRSAENNVQVDYMIKNVSYGPVILTLGEGGYNFAIPEQGLDIPFPGQLLVFILDGGMGREKPSDDADHLSRLDERGKKSAALKALRIVVPQASDLAVGSIRHEPVVLVQMKGQKNKMPSIMFGAGAQKILSLALVLNSYENGLFLVDEITVGWHHSHLADLWRLIFRICKERNHQIIATTHSDEGITAFVQAAEAEKAEDECCYVRLDPPKKGDPPGKINAVYFDYKLLRASRELRVEAR